MSSRLRYAVLCTALVLAVAATAAADSGEPVELRGSPLGDKTGLRLVVADSPPFVIDVDTGSVTRLRGVRLQAGVGFSVLAVSQRAAVVIAWGSPSENKRLYLVRAGHSVVTSLGSARDLVPAANGRGIWVTRVASRAHCVLQRTGLDGRRTTPHPIPCTWVISPGGSLGLVIRRARVIDPLTGRAVMASRRPVLAVAGRRLLLLGLGPDDAPNGTVTLRDASTNSEHTLRVPNRIGSVGPYLVDPQGRYIAVELGNPSWNLTGMQVLDVWVIDTMRAAVTHLPGMPAFVSLKRTSMEWTHDGRLVLLGEDGDRAFVAVWRPGQRTLRLKLLHLPEREGTSDSFAPLR